MSFWKKKLTKKGTTEQNNQPNILEAFAFSVVNVNSKITVEYFEDFENLIILNILKDKSLAFWAHLL